MSDKFFTKLKKDGNFILLQLFRQKNDKNPKELVKTREVSDILEKLKSVLEFQTVEDMKSLAETGDELQFYFDRKFSAKLQLPFEDIQTYLDKFKKETDSNMPKRLYDQLFEDFKSDLAAGSIESIYEQFAYQIFGIIQELAVDKLIIDAQEFEEHDRLITLITKHAPLVNLEVEII